MKENTYSEEIILKTRSHFIDIYKRCINEAVTGQVRVNDLEDYKSWNLKKIEDMEAGKGDHTFTFLQMAHYFETGICVPLLKL